MRTMAVCDRPSSAFGHEVGINVLGIVTNAMVFFADPAIDKNVLGRIWMAGSCSFRLGPP
jgi:hypothetical protein